MSARSTNSNFSGVMSSPSNTFSISENVQSRGKFPSRKVPIAGKTVDIFSSLEFKTNVDKMINHFVKLEGYQIMGEESGNETGQKIFFEKPEKLWGENSWEEGHERTEMIPILALEDAEVFEILGQDQTGADELQVYPDDELENHKFTDVYFKQPVSGSTDVTFREITSHSKFEAEINIGYPIPQFRATGCQKVWQASAGSDAIGQAGGPKNVPFCSKFSSEILQLRQQTNSYTIQCTVCNTTFSNRGNLARHLVLCRCKGLKDALKLNGIVTCFACEEKCESLENLKTHLSESHGYKSHACTSCGISFQSHKNLLGHLQQCKHKKSGETKTIKCEPLTSKATGSCSTGNQKINICNLNNHLSSIHGLNSFQSRKCENSSTSLSEIKCKLCQHTFTSKGNLNKHLYLYRCRGLPMYFALTGYVDCYRCNKKYPDIDRLRAHLLETHDVAFLACKNCGISFHKLSTLLNHEQLCLNISSFSSGVRERKSKLVGHRESLIQQSKHRGQSFRNVQCDTCKKTFSKMSNMVRHKALGRCRGLLLRM